MSTYKYTDVKMEVVLRLYEGEEENYTAEEIVSLSIEKAGYGLAEEPKVVSRTEGTIEG